MKPYLAALAALLAGVVVFGFQAGTPSIAAGGVVDPASYGAQLAPGSLLSVYGSGLAETTAVADRLPLPSTLAGVSLEVSDGTRSLPAPLFYISPGQINGQVPAELRGSEIRVRVRRGQLVSGWGTASLAEAAPRLFSQSRDGKGPVLAFHADGGPVTDNAPAEPGEVIVVYLLGLGNTAPPVDNGAAAGGLNGESLSHASLPVTVRLGNAECQVLFAGLVPGLVGLGQLNFAVPAANLLAGDAASALQVTVGSQTSQPGSTLPLSTVRKPSEFHVSPSGTASGNGSLARPWDLATALKHPAAVRPGDTIWLHGGVYRGTFESTLNGSPQAPIVVRQSPGETAHIDGGSSARNALTVNGSWTWFWGFEVSFSDTKRITTIAGSFPGDIRSGNCIEVFGPNTKFINLVLHDCSQGYGFWVPAVDAEIYGNLIYHNGWAGPDRGHGHGIYAQNNAGTKTIADNIIFNQFALGIQPFGSASAFLRGFDIIGNIVFHNGLPYHGGLTDNILLGGGGESKERIRLQANYTYHKPSTLRGYSRNGWQFDVGANGDTTVVDNYWIGGSPSIEMWNWKRATFQRNVTYSRITPVLLSHRPEQNLSEYVWDNNRYYGSSSFRYQGQGRLWAQWLQETKLDANSQFQPSAPTGVWTFVRPNKYEKGRGHIVVYNWDLKNTVAVDLSSVLDVGAEFEIRDAQNYRAAPVVTGRYAGGEISLPATGLTVAAPVGEVPTVPTHTGPEFLSFVIQLKQGRP